MNVSLLELSDYIKVEDRFDNNQKILLPIWLKSVYLKHYQDIKVFVVENKAKVLGIWAIPLTSYNDQVVVKRKYRFFPYCSPFIFEKDNLKRRSITRKFVEEIIKNFELISLPMSPEFNDLAWFQARGAFIEWRHTHILKEKINITKLNSRLRNHINSAQKNVIISKNKINDFDFNKAIIGSENEVVNRENLAKELFINKDAVIFLAKSGSKITAGLFIMLDRNKSYLLHSYQNKQSPRGTMSYLIYKSINWIFNNGFNLFDFEGSVIQSIDTFFSGFNAKITSYGYVHWSNNQDRLGELIDTSINTEGRIVK